MKRINVVLIFILSLFLLGLGGCWRAYDEPELIDVEPSQTAYLIPLVGATSDQQSFKSEDFLDKNKVATKQVQIPHRWIDTGRMPGSGKWIAAARLIVVERKPVTRMWTESPKSGTSTNDDGISAESKGSISFVARMNCVAQIDVEDATKFLFRYNNKPLDQIMDQEVKARIESKFVEENAKREMAAILLEKAEIMKAVREDVIPYFKSRGITITVLGLKGDLTYLDPEIQTAINAKFRADKEYAAQKVRNLKDIEMATAQATAELARAEATARANVKVAKSLTTELVKYEAVKKWDGKLPTVSGESTPFVNLK
jgi:hypothetical protein